MTSMLKIIQDNRGYFALYFALFLTVFIWQFRHDALEAFFIFSKNRSAFGDAFFKNWTLLGEQYPFITFAIFFIIINEKSWTWQFAIGGLAVLGISFGLKELFAVPRPAVLLEELGYTSEINFVKGVEIMRGATSFPSGHTTAAFCVWSLLAFRCVGNPIAQVLCLTAAFLVGVSRVYLIQHFPEDALFGSAIGLAIAVVVHYYLKEEEVIGVNKTKVIAVHTVNPDEQLDADIKK
jgi:membrane-associated phospholipid phosphatase